MFVSPDSIVCGVDGGPDAVELARVAHDLATVLDAPLNLVHVLGASPAGVSARRAPGRWTYLDAMIGGADDVEADALATLDTIADAVGDATVSRHLVPFGDPGRRIAKLAEEWRAEFIVVGTRGNAPITGALGSVSVRLAADAPCPVLVVPPGLERHVAPRDWRGRTLVCGFDGSAQAWSAVCHTAILASRLGGSLRVVSIGTGIREHAVRDLFSSVHDVVRAWATQRGERSTALDVDHELRRGDPAEELERVAATATAPLIAVGSRGVGPWDDGLLGAMTRRLLRTSRRPVLIAPATR
jgi:nucleotide-binding universal stress UspA family protein